MILVEFYFSPKSIFWDDSEVYICCVLKGRWKLPQGPPGSQEGRVGRAAQGVHQRMEETEGQGGGRAQEAEGEAGQEEGNQVRNT